MRKQQPQRRSETEGEAARGRRGGRRVSPLRGGVTRGLLWSCRGNYEPSAALSSFFFFFLSSMDAGICQLCMLTSYQEKSVSCQFAISGFRPRRTEARAKFPSTRGLGTDPEGQRPGCQNVSSCRQGSRGNDSAAFICLGKGESNLKNQAPPLYVEGKHLQDTGQ